MAENNIEGLKGKTLSKFLAKVVHFLLTIYTIHDFAIKQSFTLFLSEYAGITKQIAAKKHCWILYIK
ncbi:hypothetical protein [Dyadobacter sediminis]|uniref:Uncharacterized protein n=1 Tax=Dyadobacter sediminis TaxID=1493691 RepID=A0A5R9KJI5_9BACT|nr:hypothetical protein [Dyadobacter sediminis]TLU96365.1 hypothetical protein FEM55_04300 [Dyadobacter sediminis]GGB81627.1 hypothetical protein GCM10011325_06380 [Dyadobacter sediminis]